MKKIFTLILCVILVFNFAGIAFSSQQNTVTAPVPGVHTVKNLIATAFSPIGSTLYVWGGGWSMNSSGSSTGVDAKTIGLGAQWKSFYNSKGSDYDYSDYRYQTRNGLDCSGFVGWTLYNTLNKKSGGSGYVMKSTIMAKTLASYGWGSYKTADRVTDYRCGDIMSTDGHVYIALGQCNDGSLLLVHSSPPCVQITGTWRPSAPFSEEMSEEEIQAISEKEEKESQAILISNYYMNKYFPQTHAKFPKHSRNTAYLNEYNQFRWSVPGKLYDPEGYTKMNVYEILKDIFSDDGLIMETIEEDIYIDNTKIDNANRQYPLFRYNNIVYYPMTYFDSRLLGLSTECLENGELCVYNEPNTELEYNAYQGDSLVLNIGNADNNIYVNGECLSETDGYPVVRCGEMIYIPMSISMLNRINCTISVEADGTLSIHSRVQNQ